MAVVVLDNIANILLIKNNIANILESTI
ncbi:BnaAnng28330D [Brassica napus]|uniref:BnaAnng28330D protein n=1 Tax=Brassica napus TaxID=3708 RepID=A0A078JTN8_BRANA|nr:BnaAnng28330D [Brassica napus]